MRQIVVLAAATVVMGAAALGQQSVDYTSKVPQYNFGTTLTEQEQQLRDNPLVLRMAASRAEKARDPYRPLYHFVSPEGNLNDPNGLCFWQGRWHLFYQGYPPDDPRQHWGHAVSDDLIHWRDLPYAIYPNPEEKCFSGSTMVEDNRVIAMYHGTKLGNLVATSSDPLLLNWQKVGSGAVIPIAQPDGTPWPYRIFDPCIWRQGEYYYSLSGATQPTGPAGKTVPLESLFRSRDLANWEYMHPFVEGDRFTATGDDGACPYFWPIGDRHILLFFSHTSGGQYLLGDYDTTAQKFNATAHGKFNHGPVAPGGVHAPSATPDGKGGVINIFNVNEAKPCKGWNRVMTLPMRLTLQGKEDLVVEPAGDVESLRGEHHKLGNTRIAPGQEMLLPGVRGNAIEINCEIDPASARMVELRVLRSNNSQEYTRIVLYKERGHRSMPWNTIRRVRSAVILDNSYASVLPEARSRLPDKAELFLAEKEDFKLRIFIDRSLVEVFVNDRQYLACRVYPGLADSTGVSIYAQGGEATLKSLDVWQMQSIYPAK